MEPKFQHLGSYRSIFKRMLKIVFDKQHKIDPEPLGSFLDRAFAESSRVLIDQMNTHNVWQLEDLHADTSSQ